MNCNLRGIQEIDTNVLQIKITLKDVKPPIWRRILLKDDITFYQFHRVIQTVMGWEGYHLYGFDVYGEQIGEDYDDWGDFSEFKRASNVKLSDYRFEPKVKFVYVYDFGDDWVHEILVEKVLQEEKGVKYPVCIKGKRSCPPEDVGGPWGYEEFLEAINDPEHPEHEDSLEWVGDFFDPEYFDIDFANELLEGLFK